MVNRAVTKLMVITREFHINVMGKARRFLRQSLYPSPGAWHNHRDIIEDLSPIEAREAGVALFREDHRTIYDLRLKTWACNGQTSAAAHSASDFELHRDHSSQSGEPVEVSWLLNVLLPPIVFPRPSSLRSRWARCRSADRWRGITHTSEYHRRGSPIEQRARARDMISPLIGGRGRAGGRRRLRSCCRKLKQS